MTTVTVSVGTVLLLMVLDHGVGDSFIINSSDLPECSSNEDCALDRVCTSGKCKDPCQLNVCGMDTICHVTDHLAMCACQLNYTGNPFTGCYPKVTRVPECITNEVCPNDRSCIDQECKNPCSAANCGENTQCLTHNHLAMCFCKAGYSGSPVTGCVPADTVSENTITTSHEGSSTKAFAIFKDEKMTWNQSRAHCNSLNMELATIDNKEEQELIYRQTKDIEYSNVWWIAGTEIEDCGNYKWAPTNRSITYSNWRPGQPNHKSSCSDDACYCIMMFGRTGRWYDTRCSGRLYHICEYYKTGSA